MALGWHMPNANVQDYRPFLDFGIYLNATESKFEAPSISKSFFSVPSR